MKTIYISLLIVLLSWTMGGCGDRIETSPLSRSQPIPSTVSTSQLAEVNTPSVIEKLRRTIDQYEPQVTLISPQPDEILKNNTVKVQIQVQDLPIFKDPDLELGPHLTLILDNNPSQAIYDISEPVVLEALSPGTHTLRVFASRPWHESFKNDGAYAQTTFHIYTKNGNNTPDPSLPLLTYSRPRGTYGAEPILLDFYLTNAPLHVVARANEDIADWRIKATVNGESFLLNDWQSLYLKGFQKGENWVQLEFIDENGNKVDNKYNNTVRIITYDPNDEDSLSKLVKGEIPFEVARKIIDPTYIPKLPPAVIGPEIVEEEPTPETETLEPTPLEEPEVSAPEIIIKEEEKPETIKPEPVIKEEEKTEVIEPETIIKEEEPQITTEAPPVFAEPKETLEPEDTLPELLEQPTIPQSEEPLLESPLNQTETAKPPVVPFPEPLLEKEIPTEQPSRWTDRLLKPFPFQKGVRKPVTSPNAVEQPEILKTEPTSPEPLTPNLEQPESEKLMPKFDNEPGKAAIPKFI